MRRILLLSILLCSTALLQGLRIKTTVSEAIRHHEVQKAKSARKVFGKESNIVRKEREKTEWRDQWTALKAVQRVKHARRERGGSCKLIEPKKRNEAVVPHTFTNKNRSIAPKKAQPTEDKPKQHGPGFPPPNQYGAAAASSSPFPPPSQYAAAASSSSPFPPPAPQQQSYIDYVHTLNHPHYGAIYEPKRVYGFPPSGPSHQYVYLTTENGRAFYTR